MEKSMESGGFLKPHTLQLRQTKTSIRQLKSQP